MILSGIKGLSKKEFDRNATIAEVFSEEVISRFYDSSLLGMFRRLLLESKNSLEIKELTKKTEEMIDLRIQYIDKNSDYKILSIKKLVQLQLGYLLLSLEYFEV